MKHIASFIDRLLARAAWWVGNRPVHGLPEAIDVYVLPEYTRPRRMHLATA